MTIEASTGGVQRVLLGILWRFGLDRACLQNLLPPREPMELPLYTIDAFSSRPFEGNPAAICPLESWLDKDILQSIAAQNNLSETAFVVRKAKGRYEIRWFTPTVEVPLCGHATLAAAFALKTELGEKSRRIAFDSKSGLLHVDCSRKTYTLDFPAQSVRKAPIPAALNNALGANPTEFYKGPYYLAVFQSEELVAAIAPDFAALRRISDGEVIVTAPGNKHDFVSRFFASPFGIDEDPVTGSAHCILTPFWANRLRKIRMNARQISQRGGELTCELAGDRVKICGAARLYARSTIYL